MDALPSLPGDSSLSFLREGYLFGHRRFESFDSDAFRTALMGRRVLFLRGTEASRFFYEEERFGRDHAMPRSVLHSLQDEGSVQTLAGRAHHARKSLFLSALDAEGEAALVTRFGQLWDAAAARRRPGEVTRVLEDASGILAHATLDWLHLPATSDVVRARTTEMMAMIDGAGSFGWRNWRGRALRRRSERWAAEVVERVRSGRGRAPSGAVSAIVDPAAGLDVGTAAVELLNLVRPIVAVGRFIAFAALALHRHPDWRELVASDERLATAFGEEVRRTTPLFPVIGGTAQRRLTWQDAEIAEGDWVILDLFATDRHPREWEDAWRFDPRRHLAAASVPPAHVPQEVEGVPHVVAQGAGSMPTGHRCPGEPSTRSLLAVAVQRLAAAQWSVPRQNLKVDLSRLPATPGSPGISIRWEGSG